jgi:hypothetical protein
VPIPVGLNFNMFSEVKKNTKPTMKKGRVSEDVGVKVVHMLDMSGVFENDIGSNEPPLPIATKTNQSNNTTTLRRSSRLCEGTVTTSVLDSHPLPRVKKAAKDDDSWDFYDDLLDSDDDVKISFKKRRVTLFDDSSPDQKTHDVIDLLSEEEDEEDSITSFYLDTVNAIDSLTEPPLPKAIYKTNGDDSSFNEQPSDNATARKGGRGIKSDDGDDGLCEIIKNYDEETGSLWIHIITVTGTEHIEILKESVDILLKRFTMECILRKKWWMPRGFDYLRQGIDAIHTLIMNGQENYTDILAQAKIYWNSTALVTGHLDSNRFNPNLYNLMLIPTELNSHMRRNFPLLAYDGESYFCSITFQG